MKIPVIVLPTYNERANIEKIVPALFRLDIPFLKILVVDDSSPDQTAAWVESQQIH